MGLVRCVSHPRNGENSVFSGAFHTSQSLSGRLLGLQPPFDTGRVTTFPIQLMLLQRL
jgi:hypothetical protein